VNGARVINRRFPHTSDFETDHSPALDPIHFVPSPRRGKVRKKGEKEGRGVRGAGVMGLGEEVKGQENNPCHCLSQHAITATSQNK
jgi:hypothetical protein